MLGGERESKRQPNPVLRYDRVVECVRAGERL